MRVISTYCLIMFLLGCTSSPIQPESNRYSIQINSESEILSSISSIGNLDGETNVNIDDFHFVSTVSIGYSTINLFIDRDLKKQCNINSLGDFISQLAKGDVDSINTTYHGNIYLTKMDSYYYVINSSLNSNKLSFFFKIKDCTNFEERIFSAYSIIQHELMHLKIHISGKYDDIPLYQNEYLATKLGYCAIFKNSFIKSISISPTTTIDYHSLEDVPDGIVLPAKYGAGIFHNEAYKLFGDLEWSDKSNLYDEIILWCGSDTL